MTRPSPDERKVARTVNRAVSHVDKKYRTRASRKIKEKLKAIEEKEPGALERVAREAMRAKPPKKMTNGKAIYSGSWRGFEQAFADDWWNNVKKPWTCAICKTAIDPNGKHGDGPSIDHVKPWATIKTEIETRIVCKDGMHWEVALTKDVREALQDPGNLVPAHENCNSLKNGPKNTDSIAPQKSGLCPGDGLCKAKKAV